MTLPSRRALLRGGVAAAGTVAAPATLRLLVPATAGASLIRYDAASPQGRAMLAIYAVAVARMMALPGTDPALTAALWDTCEAHFDPRRTDFFLPWHRLFT